jgi:hypothetical protein
MPPSALPGRIVLIYAAGVLALVGALLLGMALVGVDNQKIQEVLLFSGLELAQIAILISVTIYAGSQVCRRLDQAASYTHTHLDLNGQVIKGVADRLDQAVARIEERLDALDEKFEELAGRVDSLNRALDIGIQVGHHEADVRSMRERR